MYSPYKLELNKEEGFYYFYTIQNIEYRCFFTQSQTGNSIISLELESEVYSFDLLRITNCTHSSFDRNVSATIGEVFNVFFDKNPDVAISYICDNIDKKAVKRQASFTKWIKTHNRDPSRAHLALA